MHCRILRACTIAGMAHGLIVGWCAHPACGAAEDRPLPPFGDVKKTVEQHFAEMPDYQPGDIVTQSEVQPLFAELKQLGWAVADQKDILTRVPTGSDFLVRQLRTRQGREVMRQIGSSPDTYDRLERLSRLPHGRLTVSRLIGRPGKGGEAIQYLATDAKGIAASKQMSQKAVGTNFSKATGRIYTEKMLLDRLKRSYQAAEQPAAPPGKQAVPPRRPRRPGVTATGRTT